jgi:hypothetical protein
LGQVKRQLKIDRHYNGREEARTANTGLAKVAVQWLNEALCFVSSSVLRIKFSAEKPAHR